VAHFGKVLFSGSRFIFWTLGPFLLLFVVVMPLTVDSWSPTSNPLVFGLDLCALLLILALYDRKRFWWAGRGVTGIVFVVFLAYLADEIHGGKPWRFGSRGEETPLDALLGLIFIGLPCLRYTLTGRFGSEQPDSTETFTWANWFAEPCPHCGELLTGHDWVMFASTVASATNKAQMEKFHNHVRTHEWPCLRSLNEWKGDQDNVEAFVLRCASGALLFLRWNPFEPYESDGLCGQEIIPGDEMAEIDSLVPATSWHPGPPFFGK
jgi:hypothetical protein